MRISGNEPLSVTLRQTKWFQKIEKILTQKEHSKRCRLHNFTSTSCVNIHGGLNTLIISGNVYGGNITVNVMANIQNVGSPPAKKRRILPIDSDSD